MADTGTYNNVIAAGAMSVTVNNIVGSPNTYSVVDANKVVVKAGAVSGTSVTIPAPGGSWPPGHFQIIFRSSAWDFKQGYVTDNLQMCVFRSGIGSFPVAPAFGSSPTPTSPVVGDPNNRGMDIPMHGLIGANFQRYELSDAVHPTVFMPGKDQGGTIAAIQACCTMENAYYSNAAFADGVRDRPKYITAPNDNAINGAHSGGAPRSGYAAGMAAAAAALGPGTASNILWWGGINEPTTPPQRLSQADSAANYLATRAAVRAGNSSALVLGPSDVGYTPGTLGDFDLWLTALGDSSPLDGLSMHAYNDYFGDFRVLDYVLSGVRALLAAHGRSPTLPIFLTETGQIVPSGVTFNPRALAQRAAQLFLTCERHGIPKEHIYIFLDGAIPGFSNISLKDANNGMCSVAVFLRVYSEEIWAKTYASALDFGTIGNNFYRGNIYRGLLGTTVSLMAQGNPGDTVTLAASDTGPLTYSDWQGNTATAAVVGGQVTLPIGDVSIYLRLSAGATVSVVDCGNGLIVGSPVNIAPLATASGTPGRGGLPLQAVSHANDNVYQTGYIPTSDGFTYDVFAGYQPFDSPVPNLPASIELDWSTPKTFRKVLIVTALPLQQSGNRGTAMTQGRLEYWDGAWLPLPTVAARDWDNTGRYINSTASGELGFVPGLISLLTWYDNRWQHNIDLAVPVTTSKLRLTVEQAAYGETPDLFSARYVGAAEYYDVHTLDFTQVIKVSEILIIETPQPVTVAPFAA
jgi:hypothetical protein